MPVTARWSKAAATRRKFYKHPEGFNAWDSEILLAPPGSIPVAVVQERRWATAALRGGRSVSSNRGEHRQCHAYSARRDA